MQRSLHIILISTLLLFSPLWSEAQPNRLVFTQLWEAANDNAIKLANATAGSIEQILQHMEKVSEMIAVLMEIQPFYHDLLFTIVEARVRNNETIFGAAIAFEPYFCPEQGRVFSPYAYRDGVNEADNEHKELFGDKRMVDEVEANRNCSPWEMTDKMEMAVIAHVIKHLQSDDITMMTILYDGKS